MSYQVSELALKCNVSKDTVRYYAKIGLLHPLRNADNGYQYFNERDMKHLDFIRRAQYLGYSLKEIKQIIEESQKGSSPCPLVRDLIQQRLKSNKERLVAQLKNYSIIWKKLWQSGGGCQMEFLMVTAFAP